MAILTGSAHLAFISFDSATGALGNCYYSAHYFTLNSFRSLLYDNLDDFYYNMYTGGKVIKYSLNTGVEHWYV